MENAEIGQASEAVYHITATAAYFIHLFEGIWTELAREQALLLAKCWARRDGTGEDRGRQWSFEGRGDI